MISEIFESSQNTQNVKNTQNVQKTKTTTKATTAPPISIWFNGNEGVFEDHHSTSSTLDPIEYNNEYNNDYTMGQEKYYSPEAHGSSEPDVYGAILQEPKNTPKVGNLDHPDEFGILKRILYKEPSDSDYSR